MIDGKLPELIRLIRSAGKAILPYWQQELTVSSKADTSPVTAADLKAHEVLHDGLSRLWPDVPVLSEEASDIALSVRQGWQRWWLVDPLDGTKEFISGSDEFTVNIALIEQGRVVWGLVGLPVTGKCYFGGRGMGAGYETSDGQRHAIHVRTQPESAFTVVASRRHSSPQQERLLTGLKARFDDMQLISIGSSLKFCLLAEGKADFYPRLAPTSQWDTAAAQGVLEGAGGEVLDMNGRPFTYDARESYLNPSFLALPSAVDWRDEVIHLAGSLN